VATWREWVEGARPRTFGAAVAPVATGTGVAAYLGSADGGRALLALVVAVALQVGVNYANEYSDGIRGTDEQRVGPVRLVGQRLARPAAVRRAALGSFGVALLAGLALVVLTQAWWLLGVGAACVAAAWLYTGGPRPYGYAGLGEAFVFVFFGVVAVTGTTFVQTGTWSWTALAASVPVGLLACAVLIANNLRDIPGDTAAGKRTLAVRLGDPGTRRLFAATVATALAVVVPLGLQAHGAWLGLLALPLAVPPVRSVGRGAAGRDLVPVLKATSVLLLGLGVLLGVGYAVSA
jgi:1,4-dihydroxy-2-naphthoate polyprenyltransferase